MTAGKLGTDRRAVYTGEQDPSEILAAVWFRWTHDDGTTVPLPDGWRTRVRAVMGAGLTADELEECVASAMRPGIREPFTYAIGAAFKILAERAQPPDCGISSFVADDAKAAAWSTRGRVGSATIAAGTPARRDRLPASESGR